MGREKLLDKLRKLKAHEESARKIGSVAEANVFAGKISQLLLEHNVSMDQVEMAAYEREEPIGSEAFYPGPQGIKRVKRRVWWQERLATIVSLAHLCRILVVPGANVIHFVGRPSHRQAAMYVYAFLVRTLVAEVDRQYWEARQLHRREGTLEAMRGFGRAFLAGALRELALRLRAVREEVEHRPAPGEVTALVRLNRELDLAKAWVDQNTGGKAGAVSGRQTSFSADGFERGQDFGKKVRWDAAREGLQGKPAELGRGRG